MNNLTAEDVALWLDEQGQRIMAHVVRFQAQQLASCRVAADKTLARYYALKDKYEPPQHLTPSYRSPPESDG